MSYIEVEYPADKAGFYKTLREQLALYTEGESDFIAVLANAASVLKLAFKEANWAGFYLVSGDAPESSLKLGPFQGKPAVQRIGFGLGVCGTALKRGESIVVEEVECFEGHIACDCNTHSEIVIPMRDGDKIIGVLDMDSITPAYFDDADREELEKLLPMLLRPPM